MGQPRIGPSQPARPCKLTGVYQLRKLLTLTIITTIAMMGQTTAQAKDRFNSKLITQCPKVVAGIQFYKGRTWTLQLAMQRKLTPSRNHEYWTKSCKYARWIATKWRKRARTEFANYLHPPHLKQFMCIHRYEAGWDQTDNATHRTYFGGLQMDIEFQKTYGINLYREKGTADHWTWLEQIWVAERAYQTRGFHPWPNTARYCGLI